MFWSKKIKSLEEKVEELTDFEKSVGKIVDNYFAKNKETQVKFSTDYTVDKFYIFVESVNEKLKHLDEVEEENKLLKEQLAKECEEHEEFTKQAKEEIERLKSKAKSVKEVAKEKKSTAKGGKK